MDKLTVEEEFNRAKANYQKLISTDFNIGFRRTFLETGYDIAAFAGEKGQQFASLDGDDNLSINDFIVAGKLAGQGVKSAALDLKTKVGSVNVQDVASNVVNTAKETAGKIPDLTNTAKQAVGKIPGLANTAVSGVHDKIVDIKHGEKIIPLRIDSGSKAVLDVANAISDIAQTATGYKGLQNRIEAKEIHKVCTQYYDAAEALTKEKRENLNEQIDEFGKFRIDSLHETLGRFLKCLDTLKQKNKVKEYQLADGIDLNTATLKKLDNIEPTLQEFSTGTAITGAFAAAAVIGTPAAITAAVGAMAAASTGTAISSLSGAAATNATLAWLGGGSIAAGGHGIAVGSVVLNAATAGVTAVVAILAAGILTSVHYINVLTKAKEFEKDTGIAVALHEQAQAAMDAISTRCSELMDVTARLSERARQRITDLENIVDDFDFEDQEHIKLFNTCGLLVKTLTELAQTPLLNDNGEIANESFTMTVKVKSILNTEV